MYIQSTASTADKVCVNHFKALAGFFCDANHDLYKLELKDFTDVKMVCDCLGEHRSGLRSLT